MANCYADLKTLKARLNIDLSNDDTQLITLLEAASRLIDKFCNRRFYVELRTWYFDGAAMLTVPDLLDVTTLKIDSDADGTPENTLVPTDYILYPLNYYPKQYVKISPYSNYAGFASGVASGVEIVALWGYGDGLSAAPYRDSGDAVQDNPLSNSATTLNVNDGEDFAIGQTLLIEDEQLYISAIATNALIVKRAQNGTTAASHVQDTTINIYQYPVDIVEACLIEAMRWFKRKDTAYQDVIAIPELGQISVYKGLDPDVKLILAAYRKGNIG